MTGRKPDRDPLATADLPNALAVSRQLICLPSARLVTEFISG